VHLVGPIIRIYQDARSPERQIENTRFIFMSCEQNAGQNQTVRMSNKSFKRVAHFKYFGQKNH
jgi:hypothetical protein